MPPDGGQRVGYSRLVSRGPPVLGMAAERLQQHRPFLWSLCYRMTGSAADADDLVQEAFTRALDRPPPDTSRDWRPWLTRVAMNLARDQLRRRRRRNYVGLWLPEPAELPQEVVEDGLARDRQASPERRYETMETLSYRFLLALEALTPAQRAVLLLRDAMDYSIRETSALLDISEANVKVTLHRARRALSDYDAQRASEEPSAARAEQVQQLLLRVLDAMSSADPVKLGALLSENAVALSDGGGATHAGRKPVIGREKIARMYAKLARGASPQARVEIRNLNGAPAIVGTDPDVKPPAARQFCLRFELDGLGRISAIHSILNPAKLARLWR